MQGGPISRPDDEVELGLDTVYRVNVIVPTRDLDEVAAGMIGTQPVFSSLESAQRVHPGASVTVVRASDPLDDPVPPTMSPGPVGADPGGSVWPSGPNVDRGITGASTWDATKPDGT